MLSKGNLSERISRLSPEKRALFEKRLRGEFTEEPESISESNYPPPEAVEEREYYPLASPQKRLFAIHQLDNTGILYNIPVVLIIEGKLDTERLYNAFQSLIERHDALRTSFDIFNDQPVQKIHKDFRLNMDSPENNDRNLEDIISEFITPFDLKKLPLFRFKTVRLAEEKYLFLMDIHHIIFDGTSWRIFFRELFHLYQGKELEPLKFQFKDFSVWQDKLLKSEFIKKQEEFWINKFSNGIPVLELPANYPRPAVQDFVGESFIFFIEKKLRDALKKLAESTGSTLYMVLVSALHILLSKYSSQEDIVTGMAVSGRVIEEINGVTGMFVNTLPLRNHLEGNKTFRIFLEEVRKNLLEVYDNQDYQIELLMDKLKIKRNPSRNPLFDVLFVLQNMDSQPFSIEELKIEKHFYHNKTSKFDLSFLAEEKHGGIEFILEYGTGLFKADTISRMVDHFKNILKNITSDGAQKIGYIDILTDEEKKQLIYDFNRTDKSYPENKLIIELFEEQVEKTPHKIALVFEDRKLTYKELKSRINQLAGLLRKRRVKAEIPAGILVKPSLEMIISVMAVLKAGGVYVPLDPSYPSKRIDFMIRDADFKVLLSQKGLYERIKFDGVIIDLEDEKNYEGDTSNLTLINKPSDLAYIIYTSGSTGNPKGVMVSHKSLTHFCLWHKDLRNLNERDNTTKLASFAFDVTLWEIFPSLISGATLHIISDDIKLSPYKLNEYYEKNNISVSFLPTQLGEQFIEFTENRSLRWLDVAGEKLRTFKKRNYTIANGYGPVEYCDCTTFFIVDKYYDNIPIGKPVWNTKVYILDKFNKPQPIGIPGELCVSGVGLSKGYLNNSELTEEKFIENPFIPGERMYKTGDLARWLSDGNIEFLGRIDKQVKIRGFRIEPSEVEQSLLKQDGIRDAAVVDYEDGDGHRYLCGYIVSDKDIDIRNLRKELAEELPEYMIPSSIIQIKDIPLTPNGKIDRKALPLPDFKDRAAKYVSPQDDIERKITEIWEEVLGTKPIGIRDNFFEVGGNSILAVRLFGKLHNIFYKDLSPSSLLKGATIEYLAGILREKESVKESKFLVPVQPEGKRPPFYCVTPVGDESLFLSALSGYLGREQPFYSLQIKKEEFLSVESLAECYIKEILAFQPEGPYFLGGFSTGVPVAFEMARQLHRKGHKAACLVIFDVGIKMSWNLRLIVNLIRYLPYWLRDFSTRPKEKITLISGTVNKWKAKIKRKFFPLNSRDQVYVEGILKNYSYESYSGSIILFRSQKHLLLVPPCYDPQMGWGKIVKGGIEVKMIPHSGHSEMFKEPYVRVLARELSESLEKAQKEWIK